VEQREGERKWKLKQNSKAELTWPDGPASGEHSLIARWWQGATKGWKDQTVQAQEWIKNGAKAGFFPRFETR